MRSDKYKILVLSDLKETETLPLQYAAKLSNEINASIEVFHAKDATEIIHTENPLTAMRLINEAANTLEKNIKGLVSPIAKENNLDIKINFGFGNVKNEIKNCIKRSQPDMIILGESKKKRFNIFGDHITSFVNKFYQGVVLVATDKNVLDANGKVSLDNLGLKNNIDNYTIKTKEELVS